MPTTLTGLALFLALLTPGFMYQRRHARDAPAYERSPLAETAGIVLVSVLADGVVAVAFVLFAYLAPDAVPDPTTLRDAAGRPTADALAVALWGTGLLGLATALAYGLAAVRRADEPAERPGWWWAFQAFPAKHRLHEYRDSRIYVGCQLRDGSYVAGTLQSHSRLSAESGDRDLLLRGEIRLRPGGATVETVLPDAHVMIVSARDVVWMTVTYSRGTVLKNTAPPSRTAPGTGPVRVPSAAGAAASGADDSGEGAGNDGA
ncbi:DUF6338 family protein [Streptomyces adustus]